MITRYQVINALKKLGVSTRYEKFTINDVLVGANIELEHGTKTPWLDVTHDDIVTTVKIALAHLYERPDYYELLLQYIEN